MVETVKRRKIYFMTHENHDIQISVSIKFLGPTTTHLFYVLSVATSPWQQQRWPVGTDNIWPTEIQSGPLQNKFADSCFTVLVPTPKCAAGTFTRQWGSPPKSARRNHRTSQRGEGSGEGEIKTASCLNSLYQVENVHLMENELLLSPTFQTVTHSSMAGSWEAKTYTLLCDITSKSRKRRVAHRHAGESIQRERKMQWRNQKRLHKVWCVQAIKRSLTISTEK